MSSLQSKKREARERYKRDKQLGIGSALDEPLDDKDDAIYDTVNEAEYEAIVKTRRERADFVVNDDGLGYHDDGEEHFYDEEDEENNRHVHTSTNEAVTLTNKALQKARKIKSAILSSSKSGLVAGDSAARKSNSLWGFLTIGSGKSSSSKTAVPGVSRMSVTAPPNFVDDLLSELDSVAPSKRPRARALSSSSHRDPPFRPARRSRKNSSSILPSHLTTETLEDGSGDYNIDDTDNFQPMDMDMVSDSGAPHEEPHFFASTKTVSFSNPESTRKEEADSLCATISMNQRQKQRQHVPTENNIGLDESTHKSVEASVTVGRRRILARPQIAQIPNTIESSASALNTTAPQVASSFSLSVTKSNFAKELTVETATPSSYSNEPTMIAAGQISFQSFVQKSIPARSIAKSSNGMNESVDLNHEAFIDMFWLDVCERNGDILLFGKVLHNKSSVSACCRVQGCVRNLYVLPKPDIVSLENVRLEIAGLLKKILPQKKGVGWRMKIVDRLYAFDDSSIPKGRQQYLKVVYSTQYPVIPTEICHNGGATFSKILNASSSATETFLIKRKFMGPCWIRLKNPLSANESISWCKTEFCVKTYKEVSVLNEKIPSPPHMTTVSFKFQTVTTSSSNASGKGICSKTEIVSIAAVFHKNMLLEGQTYTANDNHSEFLCLIRPLSSSTFPRDIDNELSHHKVYKAINERAMLSQFITQLGQWDPDFIVGHNVWGYDLELLLSRCNELKIGVWSKIGRCRSSDPIQKFSNWNLAKARTGRLVCDTYLSAQELLRETSYSLTNLTESQLKTDRIEIEAIDVPQWFQTSTTIAQLALHTLLDAHLVHRLMLHLQILPLTLQLTCVAGNLWSHTLMSNRAERTEYLLLHEFHKLKFIPPEKKKKANIDSKASKAKYAGGLVLEPKKGLYDSYILLLDFNSLYPSIIQEYNLCFTTIDWADLVHSGIDNESIAANSRLPPIPDPSNERGVLPRVVQSLVDRRREVKKLLKSEKSPQKKTELDIRQQALKLTANSMYGCLGFSNSRFFAQPIAALVTFLGREILQRTVDIAQNNLNLEVIYGDTDSIMINTRVNDEKDLGKVKELGEKVKKEVNRLYKTLELEIDGIFRSILLLKKKKYAAKTVEELSDGRIRYGQELKGLDLVRRDWCVQSKDTGRYVTEQILSGLDSETVAQNILSHLETLAAKMRSGELTVDQFVITKGLSKHPNDYPDAKSQPHVQVAKMMIENNRPVNTGDHIPYIITALTDVGEKGISFAERARHPDDIIRSDGALKPDVEWYLVQQILPPVSRLCDPIEGLSQPILADKLGIDGTRFKSFAHKSESNENDALDDYAPASFLPDKERFKGVRKLRIFCSTCRVESEFPGVFHVVKDDVSETDNVVTGLRCTNPDCHRPMFWGQLNHFDCFSQVSNTMAVWVRGLTTEYYEGLVRCDEPGCGLETRQLSVCGSSCLRHGCLGQIFPVDTERDLHTHLTYLYTLCDHDHASEELRRKNAIDNAVLSKADRATFDELHIVAKEYLNSSAFNFISPTFWKGLFGTKTMQ